MIEKMMVISSVSFRQEMYVMDFFYLSGMVLNVKKKSRNSRSPILFEIMTKFQNFVY